MPASCEISQLELMDLMEFTLASMSTPSRQKATIISELDFGQHISSRRFKVNKFFNIV
jgi:hypothetical protein